jgi:hypothetical protein
MDRKEMFIVRTNRRRANGARGEGLRHLFTVVER